ncbi:DUF4381 domain-containing protein [Thiolapillus sp.]
MNPDLLARMRDIHELNMNQASWWPPAPGWWLVGAAVILLLVLLWWGLRNLMAYPPGTWHRDARNQLLALRRLSRQLAPEQGMRELSELMRRIAVTRLGREQAAGLVDEEWLCWLEARDPEGFPWTEQGQPLVKIPYAPPGRYPVTREELLNLIQAALAWARYDRKLLP